MMCSPSSIRLEVQEDAHPTDLAAAGASAVCGCRRGRAVRWRVSRALLVNLLVAICILLAVSRASAAWDPPRWVSPEGWGATDSPTVAVDRQGGGLLVWVACDLQTPGCYHQVQARRRSRTGSLGPVMNVSELGPEPAWPQVASDDAGDSVVVWQQHDTHTNWRIAARRVGRRGVLGPLLMLTPDEAIGDLPQVALAPGGRALVAWSEYRPTTSAGSYYTVVRQIFSNGTVGRALDLGPGSPEPPAIAMDRHGVAVVAWTDYGHVLVRRVRAAAVSPTRVIASGGSGLALVHASSSRDGDFVISFRSALRPQPRIWLRSWRRDGSLGRPLPISPPHHYAGFLDSLATDLDGDSVVVWTEDLAVNRRVVYGRRVSRRGTLGEIVRLGVGDHPDVAVDDDGDGIAVWQPLGDETNPVWSRTIPRSGSFGSIRTIGSDGRVPRVAMTPAGRVVAVWQQHTAPYRIQTSAGP
jgi:hypothetical protein